MTHSTELENIKADLSEQVAQHEKTLRELEHEQKKQYLGLD